MTKPSDVSQEDWERAVFMFENGGEGDDNAILTLANAIMAARLQEREECAKVAEEHAAGASASQAAAFERGNDAAGNMYWSGHTAALTLADAIRARK